jgi:hypothetical protein
MKAFWKSKTLWFNAAGLGIWALDKYAGVHAVSPETLVPTLAVGNKLLRLMTTEPVAVTDRPTY